MNSDSVGTPCAWLGERPAAVGYLIDEAAHDLQGFNVAIGLGRPPACEHRELTHDNTTSYLLLNGQADSSPPSMRSILWLFVVHD
jgi:hypothetical protein